MPPLRLLLIDAHPLVRRGLRQLLAHHDDLVIVGEASDGPSALQQAERLTPDVALCDSSLPGIQGLDLIRALRQHHPHCGVIALTEHDDDEQCFHVLEAGAAAYATKAMSGEALVALIRRVGQGSYVINEQVLTRPRVAGRVLEAFSQVRRVQLAEGELFAPLTAREAAVLECVARGHSNKEIAQQLAISVQTVKNHMTSVLRKLAVNDRTQAVLYGVRHGWTAVDAAGTADRQE